MRRRRVAELRAVRRWGGLLAALALCGCALRSPAEPGGSASNAVEIEQGLPIPEDLREGVRRASALGASLFVLDASAALARAALSARDAAVREGNLGHYLAFLGGDADGAPDGSVQVMFFTDEHVPRLAYRVRVASGQSVRSEVVAQDPPQVVHEPLMTLLSARQLALEALAGVEQPMSPVLMPQGDGQIVVYLLASADDPSVAAVGPHFRVEVASDGAEVESVMALPGAEPPLEAQRGARHQGVLAVLARGTEHPTEAHVFASRMANAPIYVTTGRGRWRVHSSRIDYLGEL